MLATAYTAFALIVTVFTPMPDGLARADVFVIDHDMTAEDCTGRMIEEMHRDTFGEHAVISCSFDYDF